MKWINMQSNEIKREKEMMKLLWAVGPENCFPYIFCCVPGNSISNLTLDFFDDVSESDPINKTQFNIKFTT